MTELTPKHVLVDLFGGADFDHEILDPVQAAEIVIERLRDAGFEIKPSLVSTLAPSIVFVIQVPLMQHLSAPAKTASPIPGASVHTFGARIPSNPGQ